MMKIPVLTMGETRAAMITASSLFFSLSALYTAPAHRPAIVPLSIHITTHMKGLADHTMKPPTSPPVMHMMTTTTLNTAPR